ncbi:hypothetical protein GCM10010398_61880 [Streptomyces fimbriatus]
MLQAGAGKERGEVTDGFRPSGGEPGREPGLVDADTGGKAGKFGEQRGVREDRRRPGGRPGRGGSSLRKGPSPCREQGRKRASALAWPAMEARRERDLAQGARRPQTTALTLPRTPPAHFAVQQRHASLEERP